MTRLAKALNCKPTDLLPEPISQLTPRKTVDAKVLESVILKLERTLEEEKVALKLPVKAALIVDLYEVALKHQSKGLNAQNPEYMRDFSALFAKAAKRK